MGESPEDDRKRMVHVFPLAVGDPWKMMEAPLRHINCRHLTLESADKLTNMSSRFQDTTYIVVFLQTIQGQIPPYIFILF